jgi:hypothetical protein
VPDIIDRLLEAPAEFNPRPAVPAYRPAPSWPWNLVLLGLLVPGDSSLLLAGTTVTSAVRFAALVTASMLGSLLGSPSATCSAAATAGGRATAGSAGACARTPGPRPSVSSAGAHVVKPTDHLTTRRRSQSHRSAASMAVESCQVG